MREADKAILKTFTSRTRDTVLPDMQPNHESIVIRSTLPEDLPQILQIERDSALAAHWPENEYAKAIAEGNRLVLVAAYKSQIRGFLVASTATSEWELENIAVSPTARRRGIGHALMAALIERARQAKATEIRQEIRASNAAAQRLGQSMGFVQEGRRRGYYRDPLEDALLFKYLVNGSKNQL